jgi:hypothetical protein
MKLMSDFKKTFRPMIRLDLEPFNFKFSLFSLGMFIYKCERPNIIQIALKRLPGGGVYRKKTLSDLVLYMLMNF